MSVPVSLVASHLNSYLQNQLVNQANPQTVKNQLQQLGNDLQVGNLTQAKQDYSALRQNLGGRPMSSALSQDFRALGQALQSGNLSAAQQAYTVIQQALGLNTAGSSPAGGAVNITVY
jgi:hypothetical protein